jgi:phage/plasmid-associated DNA primase
MTGYVNEHVVVFLYGKGANGKSVFVSTVSRIFGHYAAVTPMEMLLTGKYDRHPTEIGGCTASASSTLCIAATNHLAQDRIGERRR